MAESEANQLNKPLLCDDVGLFRDNSTNTHLLISVCFVWAARTTPAVLQLMVFLIHGSNPFKHKPFHNFLNFWCHFHPIITPLSLIFISQCTCNENIRPWHHFSRIKMLFNLMSLAVKQHCPRDVIRTKLSSPPLFFIFFILRILPRHVGPLW